VIGEECDPVYERGVISKEEQELLRPLMKLCGNSGGATLTPAGLVKKDSPL
jgi:hypothetical protein